jgi:hypothetical protein
MANTKLNGPDYLLLLLYLSDKAPIKGAIRLTKMMFLFEKELADILKKKGLESNKLPEFYAYHFGPFSKELYDQIELFRGIKFITVTNINPIEEMSEVDDLEESEFIAESFENEEDKLFKDGKYMKYEIANLGIRFVEERLLPSINAEQRSILETFKNKINALPPKFLLHYVYTKYPDYTQNSFIKDEVLGNEQV